MPLNDLAVKTLTAGLTWLYDTEQPPGALVTHHGEARAAGDLDFSFSPQGRCSVIVMDIVPEARRYDDELTNPLTQQDVDDLKRAIADLGHRVVEDWNGAGCVTVSVRVAGEPHPTLSKAHAAYRDGCPKHHSVFCGGSPAVGGSNCPWWTDGYALLTKPEWPPYNPEAAAPPARPENGDKP